MSEQLLPIKLKASDTVFDLSNRKNAHIVEDYIDEFMAVIEKNKLESTLGHTDIPLSQPVNTRERL